MWRFQTSFLFIFFLSIPSKATLVDLNANLFNHYAHDTAYLEKVAVKSLYEKRDWISQVTREEIDDRVSAYIHLVNLESIKKLKAEFFNPKKYANSPREPYLTQSKADTLYHQARNHPVASPYPWVINKYDPGYIGFCFGRAMAVHLSALSFTQINKYAVAKAWVVGDLRTGDVKWSWHVTTLVRAPNGNYWAIDPITNGVKSIDDWYDEMRSDYDHNKKARIYFSEARKFGPTIGKYNNRILKVDTYNGYFDDLMKWSREENKKKGSPTYY